MAAHGSDRRRVSPGRNSSNGTPVLDHEAGLIEQLGVDKADLMGLVPQPVVVMDCDHTILYLNKAAAQAAGKEVDSCLGLKFWDLFDNPGCHAGTCAAAQAVNSGKTCSGEAQPVIQGKKIAVRVTAAPIFDGRHQVKGVVELVYPVDAEIRTSEEILRLAKEVQDGKLAERASLDGFEGRYRVLLEEVNGILDSIVEPLKVTSGYIDRLGKGDVPPKIAATYKGDFNLLKDSLNSCIDAFSGLSEADAVLQKMAVNDYTSTVEGKYQGAFATVAQSVNLVHRRVTHLTDTVKSVANGDLSELPDYQKIGRRSVADELVPGVIRMMEKINRLVTDSEMLTVAASEGKFEIRAEAANHDGKFRQVVEGINKTLDVVVDKLYWYQAIIDAVPSPIHVIDKDMKWVFLNKAFEKLMVDNGIIRDRHEAPGMPCSSARANICKTDNCGLVQLGKGVGETYFDWNGLKCKQESSKLTSKKGEHVGFVEVVQDLTPIVAVKDYTSAEVLRLGSNLERIAKGELNVNLKLADADKYTAEVKAQFAQINDSLVNMVNAVNQQAGDAQKIAMGDLSGTINIRSESDVVAKSLLRITESLKSLVTDADMLAKAASDGRVGTRADATKHNGEYRKIIEGVNQTLEAVVAPLRATAESASTLASSSEELTAVSQQMAGNAEETATQANVVSAASEQISRNVASVASASEQMQASIREIAKNANESAHVAKNAVSVAQSTNQTVSKLGESSREIGNVIKVITSIAQQTNLLALNATIEAARAGEAGKGFAVVANEVKELAKQTAKATEDIGRKIEAIQGDTKGAVKAIEEIGEIIRQINDISNSIATAVEEQTVTTNEIGRSVTEAAKGVDDIAKNIGGVAVAAKNTTQGANDTQKASQELSQMAARLQSVISKFTF